MRILKHPLSWVFAFLGAMFVIGGLYGAGPTQQQQRRTAEGQQAAKPKARPTLLPAPQIKGPSAEKDQRAVAQTNEHRSKEQGELGDVRWTDIAIVLFTGLLTTVGGLQAYYTFGNVVAARRAADAAHKSADEAKVTVDTMKDTAQRQLRAYVCVMGCDFKNFDDVAKPLVAQLGLKNAGATPAYKVRGLDQDDPRAIPIGHRSGAPSSSGLDLQWYSWPWSPCEYHPGVPGVDECCPESSAPRRK